MNKILKNSLVVSMALFSSLTLGTVFATTASQPVGLTVVNNITDDGVVTVKLTQIKPVSGNIYGAYVNQTVSANPDQPPVTASDVFTLVNIYGQKKLNGVLQVTFEATFDNTPAADAVTGTFDVTTQYSSSSNSNVFLPLSPPEQDFTSSDTLSSCTVLVPPSADVPQLLFQCGSLYSASKK